MNGRTKSSWESPHWLFGVILLFVMPGLVPAHVGRRFAIEVVDDQLQAQGINGGPDDGAPALRPYLNSLHDHFRNIDDNLAIADLPGFSLPPFTTALVEHDIYLEWTRVRKWVDPPRFPTSDTVPTLSALHPGERMTIFAPQAELNSDTLGIFLLEENASTLGDVDLDLLYQINKNPVNEIFLLEFKMSATPSNGEASELISSDPIYVALAPDGDTPGQRLSGAALFLEAFVATVPEPGGGVCWWGMVVLAVTIRRGGRSS